MTENEPMGSARKPSFVMIGTIFISTAFLVGAANGYADKMRQYGESVPSAGVLNGAMIAIGVVAMTLYLRCFGKFWRAWSQRKRLYLVSLVLAAALGIAISIGLRAGGPDGAAFDPFGNGPVTPLAAWLLSAAWLGGMTISIALYQRNIDEHEKQAYLWAGAVSFNAVMCIAPVWWLLGRAGTLPPVDAMALFLIGAVANAAVYLWLKFR
jgi:hypothetical protein